MVIAVDVDGTLFDGHTIAPEAITALRRARDDGHLLVIVTGRRWETLPGVLGPALALFHRVVGEEGGFLADVASGVVRLLAPPLDRSIVDALRAAGVEHLDIGRATVSGAATATDAFTAASAAMPGRWHVVVNKESVALSPTGHDKGTGLRSALADLDALGVPVLAIGDAANDLPMFAVATVAVGVANADRSVTGAGIALTKASFGDGVAEALQHHLPTR
jgi:hydroxymethylpyrimidine pyrophosphatase-like HAD family hydrolase